MAERTAKAEICLFGGICKNTHSAPHGLSGTLPIGLLFSAAFPQPLPSPYADFLFPGALPRGVVTACRFGLLAFPCFVRYLRVFSQGRTLRSDLLRLSVTTRDARGWCAGIPNRSRYD